MDLETEYQQRAKAASAEYERRHEHTRTLRQQSRAARAAGKAARHANRLRAQQARKDTDPSMTNQPDKTASLDTQMAADRPRIVVLCGSTRFGQAFREANLRETVAGRIVLSIGCDLRSDGALWPNLVERNRIKVALDELHKRKIDLADEVLVLNVDGYIGNSTRSEIQYAISLGKPIRYLEPVASVGRVGRAGPASAAAPSRTGPDVGTGEGAAGSGPEEMTTPTRDDAYGDATIVRLDDGTLSITRADPIIGMSLELLAQAGDNLPVDESGCILLAGDPAYQYRPIRFAGLTTDASGPCRILVCQRVEP
jgi:hypothetical protein